MRLQRDVAEILQRHDAQRVGVPQQRGNRQRHLPEQLGDIGEGQRGELDRSHVQGEHDRRLVGTDDAEVSPVRRVAGQGHHPGGGAVEAHGRQVAIDPIAQFERLRWSVCLVMRAGGNNGHPEESGAVRTAPSAAGMRIVRR